jgi:single-strand DNA-binding protein
MFTTTTMFQGNLTADPRLRHTAGGTAVAEFRVLVNQRVNDGERWIDGEPTGHNVKVYGRLAEAVVEQLRQGGHVIVIGRTETTAWPDRDTGEKRTATRVIVDHHGTVGLALPTPARNPRADTEQDIEQDIEQDAHGSAVRTAQPATADG